MTRPAAEVDEALALFAAGRNPSEIARLLGLNRSTVRDWIARPPAGRGTRHRPCPRCDGASLDGATYCYLLGLYLGDGCITAQPKGVWRLRIFQTARYVDHIAECVAAMAAVLPNNVLVLPKGGCVEIGSSSKHWPCLFPQHGPGRKHERVIVLEPWQAELADGAPKPLVRGLIQSDGCRDVNFTTKAGRRYEYPRYSFKNRSADILEIFTRTCDALGVHWTRANATTISIARRADVAFVDTFVGPKS